MALSDEDVNRIAEAVVKKAAEAEGIKVMQLKSAAICKCVDWFLVATTAAEALEHNATVSDMAKGLHKNLKDIIPREQLEDLEFKHPLLQGYLTENIAEMALSGSLGSIRDKCNVDISEVKKLAANGFKAIRRRDPQMATDSFSKVKVELLNLAGKICGEEGSNPGLTTKLHTIGNPMAPTKEVLKLEVRIPLELLWKDEPKYLEELTQSIMEHGITEPITIRIRGDGSMIVWDGLHRLAVAEKLGIEQIPVIYIRR